MRIVIDGDASGKIELLRKVKAAPPLLLRHMESRVVLERIESL